MNPLISMLSRIALAAAFRSWRWMPTGASFWTAPVLWRFGYGRRERQRTAAVEDAGAVCPPIADTHNLWMHCALAFASLSLIGGYSSFGALREPDNLVFGSVYLNATLVTATQTNLVIEARRSADGPAIASYRMGTRPQFGDQYSLRIHLETRVPSGEPPGDTSSAVVGENLLIFLRHSTADLDVKPFVVGGRGALTRLDFGSPDSDSDGLLDGWEREHFGNTNNPDGAPGADPDGDGANNLAEFLAHTDPLVPDTRHPADMNPANYALSIAEVTAYGLAWRLGETWPIAPTDIPASYVTRAGALWRGGENYGLDLTAATTPPNWWVNVTNADLVAAAVAGGDESAESPTASTAIREIAPFVTNQSFVVTITITPAESISAYTVEEEIPDGWLVSDVSEGGSFITRLRRLRWGPFIDNEPRTLSYQLTAVGGAPGASNVVGVASFDGTDLAIVGASSLSIAIEPAQLMIQRASGGSIRIGIIGTPNQSYLVESSENLTSWTEFRRVTLDSSGRVTLDTETASAARLFFRAKAHLP